MTTIKQNIPYHCANKYGHIWSPSEIQYTEIRLHTDIIKSKFEQTDLISKQFNTKHLLIKNDAQTDEFELQSESKVYDVYGVSQAAKTDFQLCKSIAAIFSALKSSVSCHGTNTYFIFEILFTTMRLYSAPLIAPSENFKKEFFEAIPNQIKRQEK